MLSPGMNLQSAEFVNSSKELYQVETVVQGYNLIVAPLASNKNQMFRHTTLNMLHELLKQVGAIRKKAHQNHKPAGALDCYRRRKYDQHSCIPFCAKYRGVSNL